MSGVMTCGQCGQEIVGAIVTTPEPSIYGARVTTLPDVIAAHNALCVQVYRDEWEAETVRDRGTWRRLTCRHQWQERWSTPFDRYWTCEKCGAAS